MDDSNEECRSGYRIPCVKESIIQVDNLLWTGLVLWKIPFHIVGTPQKRILNIKKGDSISNRKNQNIAQQVQVLKSPTKSEMERLHDPLMLEVIDAAKSNSKKEINVKDILEIKEGQSTQAFQAFKARHGKTSIPSNDRCFSLICTDRTFDFYTDAPSLTSMMVEALRRLLLQVVSSLPSSSLKALTVAKLRNNVDPSLSVSSYFESVKNGDVATFIWYLQHGLPVDTMENNERRDTALMAACRLGRVEIVKLALQHDAKNDPHPQFGQTALQVAVASGRVECVRLILETAAESGADKIVVNHEDSNREAPIHVASRCGNISILELLIDHGSNMSLVDAKGRSCLHCATQSGYDACLDFLLSTGCGFLLDEKDYQGYTCLHLAVKSNRIECARTLLESGADLDVMTSDGRNAFMLAEKLKSDKMLHLLIQFESQKKLSSLNLESYDVFSGSNHEHEQSQENMFEGLSLFNVCDGVSSPCIPNRFKSTTSYDFHQTSSRSYSYDSIDHLTKAGRNSQELTTADEHNYFYLDNEVWFMGFSSGNYFFVREVDSHSQWYDPRYFGIVDYDNYAEGIEKYEQADNHILMTENLQCTTNDLDLSKDIAKQPDTGYSEDSNGDKSENHNIIQFSFVKDISNTSQSKQGFDRKNSITHGASTKETESTKIDELMEGNKETLIMKNSSTVDSTNHKIQTGMDSTIGKVGVSNKKSNQNSISPEKDNQESIMNCNSNTEETPSVEKTNVNLTKYRKMSAVGIPLESVIHKMKMDGVNADVIYSFRVDQSNTVSHENLLARNSNEDTDKTLSSSSYSSEGINLSNSEKLKQLVMDGHSKNTQEISNVSQHKLVFQDLNNHENRGKENESPNECQIRFNNDNELKKYQKMASVGVPHQSIANKMHQDGIPTVKIECFEIAFGLNTVIERKIHESKLPLSLPQPPPVKRRTSVRMQKIHWKPVSDEKVRDSVWADSVDYDSHIDDKDIKELENLFGAIPSKTSDLKVNKGMKSVPQSIMRSTIESKRANNIAISLAQFRSFQNYDDLCEAVTRMDSSKLNSEQLQNMRVLLPTRDELGKVKQLNGRTDGLVRAELFFLSVSKYPRFAQKLDAFIFSLIFESQIIELKDTLSKLKKACEDVVNNKKLAAILRKLLAIGNLVNEGAGKTRARGITVDSLLKTAKKTGSDGKTSVIYIVVANTLKMDEAGDSVEFWNEIGSVKIATRIDINDCWTSLKEIQVGMKRIDDTVQAEEKNNGGCNYFINRSRKFLEMAMKKTTDLERELVSTGKCVESLCLFFAEDPQTCKATTIFELLLEFSQVVKDAKDSYERKLKAMKRKAKMNTPIKVTRTGPPAVKNDTKKSIDSTLSSIIKARSSTRLSSDVCEISSWEKHETYDS